MDGAFQVLVLVTLSCFITTTALATTHPSAPVVTVRVLNALPDKSKAMQLQCKSSSGKDLGRHVIGVGGEYRFRARVLLTGDTYFCAALWGSKFASWHALEPQMEKANVVWMVNHGGFYLRSDDGPGPRWLLKATWESE